VTEDRGILYRLAGDLVTAELAGDTEAYEHAVSKFQNPYQIPDGLLAFAAEAVRQLADLRRLAPSEAVEVVVRAISGE